MRLTRKEKDAALQNTFDLFHFEEGWIVKCWGSRVEIQSPNLSGINDNGKF
ncbi:MAG: hypothetical protein AAF694_23350 [Bacteroidota bacterium]